MERNRNQEHISIRADASEPLKAIHRKGGRDTIFPVSIRADASELLEAIVNGKAFSVASVFQFALMRVSSSKSVLGRT